MKKLFSILAVIAMIAISAQTSFSQLSGTKTIPGDYATIQAAITALNANGVGGGGVTFNVTAGHTETIPTGGFVINIATNQPNASNQVIFQKSGAGIVTIQSLVAGSGSVTGSYGSNGDAFFKLNGTDWITFDGFTLVENYTGVTTSLKMEFGFMLCRASATDGCKNVTIRNNTVNMQLPGVSHSSAGVYLSNYTSGGTLTNATSIAGRHENVFIDGNTIQNVLAGVYCNGTTDAVAPYSLYDNNIQIGTTTGNTLIAGHRTTYTANTNTTYGIYAINGDSVKFNNNIIRVNTGSNTTATHYGIFTSTGTNSNAELNGNNISDTAIATTTSQQAGIVNTFGTTGTNNTVNIQNNTITNCLYSVPTSGTASYIQNSAGAFTINISGNTIQNNTYGAGTSTATGVITAILQSTSNSTVGASLNIYNNTISNLSRTQSVAGTGQTMGIQLSTNSYNTYVYGNNINTITNNSTSSTTAAIYTTSSATNSVNFYNNTIYDIKKLSGGTTGPVYGIYASQSSPNCAVYGNTVYNLINTSASVTTATMYGYYNNSTGSTTENFYNNTFYNFTNNGTGTTYAANVTTGGVPTKQIYGNNLYNITGNGQTGALVVNYLTTSNVYNNKFYNITSNGITNSPNAFGLLVAGGTTNNIYNNFIHEIKAPNSNVATTPYFGCGGLWINGGTTANVFYNTVYLDASSIGTNFTSAAFWCSATPTADVRNNIFINKSTPSGAGFTVAHMRNSSSYTTYSANSDRNNFYAGTPGANRLIFYDYLNSVQTLAAYKSLLTSKDQNSVTDNTAFVNTSVSPYDLHLSSCATNQLESNGSIVSTPISITTDYDGNARYNNAGYPQCSTYTATAPDIGADEFGGQFLDAIPPVITYSPLGNTNSISNRSFTGVTITDATGINVTAGTKPRCYFKKSTDANTYAGNTFFDNGWKWVEANGGSSPFDFTIDYSMLFGGLGVTTGDVVQYFVIAQDLAGTPNVTINSGTPAGTVTSVSDYANIFPLTGTINQYNISATFAGVYTVGTTGFDNFTTLTGSGGLFANLNAGVMTGNITVSVTTDLVEDGTNDLNALSYDVPNANYTLRIVPSAATERLISGNVASGLIRFDGNDYVTIDGNNGLDASGTQYLRFRNTSGAGPTFSFFNDSKNNTITNCIIESNNTNLATLPGTILFGTTLYTDGNDNNTFSDCEIRDNSDFSGTPTIAIYSAGSTGTTAQQNSGNTITGCNIHDFFTNGQTANSAIYMNTGTTGWTITNNSMYQTSTRTTTTSTGYNVIILSNSNGDGFTITGNYIGGTAPNCGGTPWTLTTVTASVTNFMYVIRFASSAVTNASTISNNTIANFDITLDNPVTAGTLYFDAMLLQAGNINISGNTIGSQSANGNIKMTVNTGAISTAFFGIDMRGAAGSITNNNVGGFTLAGTNTAACIMVGINEGSTVATSVINVTGNTIGGSVSNSMYDSRGGATIGQITGIRSSQAGPTSQASYSNNTIRNLTDLGTGGGFMCGISHSGATPVAINNCSISNLNSASSLAGGFSGTFTMCGVSLTSGGVGASISNNNINNINNNYTGVNLTYVIGYQVTSSAAVVTESKNKIYGLTNQSTGAGATIIGINHYWGTAGCTITNNMITLTNGDAALDKNSAGKLKTENNQFINPVEKTPVKNSEIMNPPVQNPPVQFKNNNSKNFKNGEGSGNSGDDRKGNTGNNRNLNELAGTETANTETVQENPYKENTELNGDFSNGMVIYGIYDDATSGLSYYYNSVYIGGSPSSGSSSSYCFRRSSTNHNLINNIFFNGRLNGGTATGKNYAIISTSTGTMNANYNVYVSYTASTIGSYGGSDQTFAQWKTSLTKDQQSWSTTASDINPVNLFNDITTGDLSIKTANTEAWLVSGKGIALASINSDYNGDSRYTSVGSGTTDIGADEFGALSTTTPTATVDNPPGDGVTSTYSLWGRPIVKIVWGTGGSVYPTSMNVYYNSGVNPPNTLGGNYSNSHTIVNEVGGPLTGATYNITYYFGDNETYTIGTPGSNTILAKYGSGSTWEVYHLSQPSNNSTLTYNTLTQTFNVVVNGLYDFSTFALTDDGAALPVVMESFELAAQKRDAILTWITVSELNNKGFGVERRMKTPDGYSNWKEVAFINGNGTSNERHVYNMTDQKLAAGVYQYRLRQVDYNNNAEYFTPGANTDLIIGKPGQFDVSQNYPNPSNPKSKIDFQMPFDGKVSIKVYDILGQQVASLVDEFKTADFYTVEFDGSNIASGTYFYRIIAEGNNQKFTKTMKMILVK